MRWQVDVVESGLLARMFGWRRLLVALVGTGVLTLILLPDWMGWPGLVAKAVAIATLALIVFGILEFWPRHLPSWLPRWLLQLAGLAVAIPIFVFRSEEHTSELQSLRHLVCRLLLEKK